MKKDNRKDTYIILISGVTLPLVKRSNKAVQRRCSMHPQAEESRRRAGDVRDLQMKVDKRNDSRFVGTSLASCGEVNVS